MGVWIATSLFLLAWVDGAQAAPPTSQEITEAVRRLGSEEFADREAAMRTLWEFGDDAVAALSAAKNGDDPEIRYRATLLLKQIALGIRPDMPADLAQHIEQYRTGDRVAKRHAIVALEARGEIGLLLKFFRQEGDEYVRQQLRDSIARHSQEMLPVLLVRQRWKDAEDLLISARQMQPNADRTLSLARFYWATGRVDTGLELLRDLEAKERLVGASADLAGLAALSGKWLMATSYAEKAGDKSLQAALLLVNQDWAALAAAPPALGTDLEVQTLKVKSAQVLLRELQGDATGANEALQQFVALRNNPAALNDIERTEDAKAKALLKLNRFWSTRMLILEQFDEAFKALETDDPILLAVLRIRRQEYAELAKFLKWDSTPAFDDAWLNSLPTKPELPRETQFDLAILSARALAVGGRRDDVRTILDTLARNPLPNRTRGLTHMLLAYAALEGDDWERFLDYSVIAREELAASTFWDRIAPQQAQAARLWDTVYEQADSLKQADMRVRITQIAQLTGVRKAPRLSPEALDKLLADTESSIAALPAGSQPVRGKLVAEAALRHGRRELASKLFDRISADDPSASMYLGDLAAADKRPQEAATWYARAWETTVAKAWRTVPKQPPAAVRRPAEPVEDEDPFGPARPARRRRVVEEVVPVDKELAADRVVLPQVARDRNALLAMYLRGKYTPGEEGEQFRRTALALVPSVELYLVLAEALEQRGYRDDARAIYELVSRLTPLGSTPHANAVSHLAGVAVQTDSAADRVERWDQARVMSLLAGATYTQAEGYCDLPRARHLARARAALAAAAFAEEDYRDALAGIELASPADMRAYETLLPLLVKKEEQGHELGLHELFERNYAFYRRLADDYPQSPHFANQLAWLCAISHRNLEEAQRLAELAVKLDQDQAAYVDTLAEVYFQQGKRELALKLSQRAMELAPNSAEMKRRLKHFQADPLPQ